MRTPSRYVVTESGCWEWVRHRNSKGYGKVRGSLAHRVLYERYRGAVPDGLELDHLCRNKACVNPDHLEPVSHQENCRRRSAAKTHCPQGHEYTDDNTYVERRAGRPIRRCLACKRARGRETWRRSTVGGRVTYQEVSP